MKQFINIVFIIDRRTSNLGELDNLIMLFCFKFEFFETVLD